MLVQQYHTGGVVTKQKLLELHDVPSNFQFVPSVSFGREHGHGVEGRRWRRSVGPPLESGVPSRSPGLQMTGVSRRGRPRGLLLSPLAPASLNFKDSFRATGSPAGKMRTFRARRILVSRAWHRGSWVSEHDDPRGERDDGRQRGPRGRRGPKRAPSLVTFSESLRIGLCNPVRLPRTREHSSPPGWRAVCSVSSVVHRRNLTIGGLGPTPWRRAS